MFFEDADLFLVVVIHLLTDVLGAVQYILILPPQFRFQLQFFHALLQLVAFSFELGFDLSQLGYLMVVVAL